MRPFLWLVRKELHRFRADPVGAVATLLLPAVLASLLGVLFEPPSVPPTAVVLVADEDGSDASRALVQQLAATGGLRVRPSSRSAGTAQVRGGHAPAMVVVPHGFGAALPEAALVATPEVTLVADPSRRMEVDLIRAGLQRARAATLLSYLSEPRRVADTLRRLARTADPAVAAELLVVAGATERLGDAGHRLPSSLPALLRVRVQPAGSRGERFGYHSHAHTFAGMICMFLLFFALENAKAAVTERDSGVLSRLRMSPAGPRVILLANAAATALVALLSTALVYGFGMAVFGVPVRGSALGFALIIAAQSAFVGGFALMVGAVARTERQITAAGTFAILLMSFLGGAWLPAFLMPEWLQGVARVLPTHWATQGLAAMTWRGLDLGAALLPAAVLTGFAALCLAIGMRTFRWERT